MSRHSFRIDRMIAKRMNEFDPNAATLRGPALVPAPENQPDPVPQAPDAGALTIVGATDIGLKRAANQDCLILSGRLCGVADGMGGHKGGEVASAMVRDTVIEHLKGKEPAADLLKLAVKAANRAVLKRGLEDPDLRGMGTTVDLLWFAENVVYIAHVGDSRVYCLRDGALQQITDDHSMVMEMVRSGVITKEQAAVHPMRNIITRAVGTEENLAIDLLSVDRRAGDIWLVCSDGLHGMISDVRIHDLLENLADHPQVAMEELKRAALDAGGYDNVTIVIAADKEGSHE